jgi:hypothetical protein
LSESKKATRTVETTTGSETQVNLLDDIVDRMAIIEARQMRPEPMRLKSWEEIERFAVMAAKSGLVPELYKGNPGAICIAITMGSELGLAPMQSLQNIAVIGGRPSVWGDALPALCRASGAMRTMREWHEGEGDHAVYHCEAVRRDDPQVIHGSFSVTDAKLAGLWTKAGPWKQYPARMLQLRARGFCLRDAFPDVLRGLITAEEAQDIPFEATGLQPRVEPEKEATQRKEKKQTGAEWLAALREEVASNAGNPEAIQAIVNRADVRKMLTWMTGTALEELEAIVASATAMLEPDPDPQPEETPA